ncbi:MAG: type II toxin-antitoxin system YafQ family toxin [Coriobacteriales bacterium]
MLDGQFAPQFARDVKKLKKAHHDIMPLKNVMTLVMEDTAASREELVRHHNAHMLSGQWKGSFECHVANYGDWLLIWKKGDGWVRFLRTGTHDELFRN